MYEYPKDMPIEIGIGRHEWGELKGTFFFTSKHPAFGEEWGERRDNIPGGLLYDVMDDLAKWACNDIGAGCYFYMF